MCVEKDVEQEDVQNECVEKNIRKGVQKKMVY